MWNLFKKLMQFMNLPTLTICILLRLCYLAVLDWMNCSQNVVEEMITQMGNQLHQKMILLHPLQHIHQDY
uniref:Putative secreted protein n=1 Tax=Panstrongylus lignarius TaxID=156445 RepID=A0A224XUJ3_9HEMI